jgi:L-threonylcarbamoyladenylate synthase
MLAPDAAGLAIASQVLRAGGLAAFPTETVYGLGADAMNDRAVARIFEAKRRPRFNPLIAHVADLEAARALGVFDARALALAAAFWPGPLTLVVPLRTGSGLSALVTSGLDSVALRVPAHPVARALLAAFSGPVAAPSANPSGSISPTRAAHVREGLGERVDAIIDGGDCAVGVESTILSLLGPAPVLLRPGGLTAEALEAFLGAPLVLGSDDANAPRAPGQLVSHYAPRARLRLNATAAGRDEVWLGFGPDCDGGLNLSPKGDLVEAAANFFHLLRRADDLAGPEGAIAAASVPIAGLGIAINDRLARAAAPRS